MSDTPVQRLMPRIVLSLAGPDGHAPLQDYSAPYARSTVCSLPGYGFEGWEYRAPGFAECAVVFRVAPCTLTGGYPGVLSFAYVPCDVGDNTNMVFESIATPLQQAGLIVGWWRTLADLEVDSGAAATLAKSLWPSSCREVVIDTTANIVTGADQVTHLGARIVPLLT